MADLVSSIVTLATVSLAIIKHIALFIRDAKKIDALIEDLLQNLLDLRKWLKVTESTWRNTPVQEDSTSRFVENSLERCRLRLADVQIMVERLASKKSGTAVQKFKLKIRSDRSKGEMEGAIQDIQRHRENIRDGMINRMLQLTADIHRRPSDASSLGQSAHVRASTETAADGSISNSSLPHASTFCESTYSPSSRRASSHTEHSQYSAWSTTSNNPQSSTAQIVPALPNTPMRKDWVEFHHLIRVSEDAEAVRQILQRHRDARTLANLPDDCGRTPLHLAALFGNKKLARTLLDFSANINAKDSQPCSVLDLALEQNRDSFVAFLLERGVDDTSVLKRNRDRLEEIKEAIDLRRSKAVRRNMRVTNFAQVAA